MSALPSKDDISMGVLALIIESIKRLVYLTYVLFGYSDADLPKKSRVYCKPPGLCRYLSNHIGEAAGAPCLAVGRYGLGSEEQRRGTLTRLAWADNTALLSNKLMKGRM